MARLLIIIGIVLLLAGLAWPWLSRLPLFHLPGDIVIERENFRFYFPITTSIIISLILSVIFWFIQR